MPRRYRSAFAEWEKRLESHRGYDPGALDYARDFARAFQAPLFYSTTSRLLVELNRSPRHRQIFSARAHRLPDAERARLMDRYYVPYRAAIETQARSALGRGRRVLHISCHSFAPRLGGVWRTADIGLLFDPRRTAEARFWFPRGNPAQWKALRARLTASLREALSALGTLLLQGKE